jgi:hypothetical protein
MSLPQCEKVWLPISDISSSNIDHFLKKDAHFMKSIDICFFIAEIDFQTSSEMVEDIIIDLPQLNYNFVPCENTVFATKNDEINTIVRIKLFPNKLVLSAFPFSPNSKYECNIQLFMRVISS